MDSDKMIVSPVDTLPGRVGKSSKEIVRKNGVSATAILTNFVCGMIGPGCFSVAISFKQSGLWVGQSLDYGDMAAEVCRHSYKSIRSYDKHAREIYLLHPMQEGESVLLKM
ncbi:hypothetical protein ANCDUO_24457 [Ancylostoma duodenale]|uniref:Uncharacterized protein n=1 Tax=Ancylostoma duodenale TaxID=51022 RepID=A0A0C2C783_9BILA|nr:hypothetical protein ANCDUO_24457 [Ancylostoma duodenale]